MQALTSYTKDKSSSSVSTAISVTARIDYILRFSKQVILVLDESPEVYSAIASQYLSTRVNTDNAAFISASSKINNIQMRCRLIEQLFTNRLFDPEQSLAVSLFKLANEQNENITIVIENAHTLSLQLVFELCQLSEASKKTANVLNIVLLGLPSTGEQIAKNRTLFNNKLTMLSASSGQLITYDDDLFKVKKSLFSIKQLKTSVMVLASLVLTAFISYYTLNQYENFSLSQLDFRKQELSNNRQSLPSIVPQPLVSLYQESTAAFVVTDAAKSASAFEIFSAISVDKNENSLVNSFAQPADIVQALLLPFDSNNSQASVQQATLATEETSKPKLKSAGFVVTPEYYLSVKEGYVIQIIGFSDEQAQAKFIEKYKNLKVFGYHRSLNNNAFTVITTRIFTDKNDARRIISSLPKDIRARGPWVKSVSAIKGEINNFLSSQ